MMRADGVVYTPSAVARSMVRRALAPLGDTIADILALRICDPAIGEGVFLLEVIELLADRLARLGVARDLARRQVAEQCVFGADIDDAAIAATRCTLEHAIGGPLPTLGGHLHHADALALDWHAACPAVFARGGFDAVVGNPPYIRQERLGVHKRALEGFAVYDGVADLYVYFVELTHRLARPGGRYCLVLPNKWMTAAYGRALRGYLATQASVDGLVDLGRATPLFAGVDAFPCILWGTLGDRPGHEPAPIRCDRLAEGAALGDSLDAPPIAQARERWQAGPWHIDSTAERTLIDRLERTWPALRDVIDGRPTRGVVTGCNRVFVIDGATRRQLIEREPASAALMRPFVKGRDVKRWRTAQIDRWIVLVDRGTSLAELPQLTAYLAQHRAALEPRPADWRGAWAGRKPGSYRWYELQDPVGALPRSRAPRLLYQDIQMGPACCLDDSGELVPDTTVWILPSADRFLLAVLNSPLYGWYARRRFPPALNGAVRPKLEYITALPIATPSSTARRVIDRLVDQRRAAAPADGALDDTIAAAVLDVYQLSAAERRLVTASAATH